MKTILTAEEFLTSPKGREIRDRLNQVSFLKADAELLIEFAKLHVEAQQEAIHKELNRLGKSGSLLRDIINNAYPLTNIK